MNRARITGYNALWLRVLNKSELQDLIVRVTDGDHDALCQSVDFFCAESFGIWHNRARAKLSRYFKNHPPSKDLLERMVDVVIWRLLAGQFSEQFTDQLKMALRFDPQRMAEAAEEASRSKKEYVQRYANRIKRLLDLADS